jgi:hypothetical protein
MATPFEVTQHAVVSNTVASWLLTPNVNESPQCIGVTYGILLFTAAKVMNNHWFTVSAIPKFLWCKWTIPCTKIGARELGWEWYLRVQDVFFRNMVEAYNQCIIENYVVFGDMAFPMNTVVPKPTSGGEQVGMASSTTSLAAQYAARSGEHDSGLETAYRMNTINPQPQRDVESVEMAYSTNAVIPTAQQVRENTERCIEISKALDTEIQKELASSGEAEKDAAMTLLQMLNPEAKDGGENAEKGADRMELDDPEHDEVSAFFTNLDERYPKARSWK